MKIIFWCLLLFFTVILIFVEYLKSDRVDNFSSNDEKIIINYYQNIVKQNYDYCITRISKNYIEKLKENNNEINLKENWEKSEEINFFWENITDIKFLKMKTSQINGIKKISFKARITVNDNLKDYFETSIKKTKNKIYLVGHRCVGPENKIEQKENLSDTVIISGFSNKFNSILKSEGFSWYDSLTPSKITK